MLENGYLLLKKYFGYDKFREGQEFLIDKILEKKDVLGVMPTGAGKSICFQIPAMLLEGITIVVSPLISLMKDQVNSLTQVGISAAYLNSSLTNAQYIHALSLAKAGNYKLIYVAPERLLTNNFLEFAHTAKISMVAIDEAHCISQWGQDFRPSYLKILDFIDSLKTRPIVSAFTATATELVRKDIVSALKLKKPEVLVTGFNRENLYFEVQKPGNKIYALNNFLENKKGKSGIIYCSTRANVEEVYETLNSNGYTTAKYHAGLSDKERHENQDAFIFDKASIIVATNAFGMGIDKSNVSFVIHFNMPKNIESYYQEAGRAGRDGEPADCILFFSSQDVKTNMYFIDNNNDLSGENYKTAEILRQREHERLNKMIYYCHTTDCLREYILTYFGEKSPNSCGNCGNCSDQFNSVDITIEAQKVLSCVFRAKECVGIGLIVKVLRGKKDRRIAELGFDKLTTFGIMSNYTAEKINDIIHFLVLNRYLYVTSSRFPLLKLGEFYHRILFDKKTINMKVPKSNSENLHSNDRDSQINPVDFELMQHLKELRLSVANRQHVPAFVIFSDSTLTDMCMKLPIDKISMLKVNGVGDVKFERYGKIFLDEISKYIDNNPKKDLTAIPEMVEIEISEEPVQISVIADRINCHLIQIGQKKVTAAKLNGKLIGLGYLENNDENVKMPTPFGKELGISSVEKFFNNITVYTNLYNKAAQEFIVGNLNDFVEFN